MKVKSDGSNTLVLLAIFFAYGIFNLLYNMFNCKSLYLVSIIIGFAPFVIVLIRKWIYLSDTVGNFKVINSYVVGIIIVLFLADIFSIKIFEWSTINTNVESYEKILRIDKYPLNNEIAHFPSSISAGLKDVDFKEWNGIGEYKSGMFLTYQTQEDKIYTKDFSNLLNSSKYKAESLSEYKSLKQTLKIPDQIDNILGLQDGGVHPDNFQIYFIDNTPIEQWNHGYSYGIAINNDVAKVTYFSLEW